VLVRSGSVVAAYFPFCTRERHRFRECYSMPMGTYGGPVTLDNKPQPIRDSFVKWADEIGFSRVNVVEFGLDAGEQYSRFGKTRQTTHVLRLNRDRDRLYSELSDNHKRNLAKAEKTEVEIVPVRSESEIEDYYRLIQESAGRHGDSPRYSLDFYKMLRSAASEQELIWQLLYLDGRPCAGHILFRWAKSIISWDSCSDSLARKKSLNYSLYWHNIESFNNQGYVSFNLGSSPQGADDLIYFKTGWGAREEEYFEYDRQSPTYRTIRRVKGWFRK